MDKSLFIGVVSSILMINAVVKVIYICTESLDNETTKYLVVDVLVTSVLATWGFCSL